MTRFARAKGSKASNERVPEATTSWEDMKKHIVKNDDKQDSQTNDSKIPAKTLRIAAATSGEDVKWSEFPCMDEKNKKLKGDKKKNKKTKPVIQAEPKIPKAVDDSKMSSFTKSMNSQDKSNKGHTKNKSGKQLKKSGYMEKKQQNISSNGKSVTSSKKRFERNNLKEYKRRKPQSEVNKIFINGNEIELAYYDGFPIKKEDAERLKKLKKEMINRGLPRSEIAQALKLERRKAEKSLAREKKKVCFNCRQSGHVLSECSLLKDGPYVQQSETGICFKCGSTEHTHFECKVVHGDKFKFAQCFICKEQGHIARQCPDNNRGLYPKGGACKVCGDVTHLKKDCPKYQLEQTENKIVVHTMDHQNIESLDNETAKVVKKPKNLHRVIKF